ncbi:respiratory nitrate reductase subunit gamma [Aquibacillus sp. 3ASR75-11]|uniref:Respiratory nitrate reductase subunit gamma n=1 Tax=Terrihalobacillus insolitus TaxID=2950438 RepID=A0A9X3WUW1_9BACI|nr:respiratory nitrate reductase subunit gamma [Terrihalobacillus insolitus]MDC3426197.1 respiratory nitrate reductase subunit gamma [Terrihalobacillus insolitus]
MILVFFGHVAGLLIPIEVYYALGVSDEFYHTMAVWGGGIAGLMAVVGIFLLLIRRFSVKRVRATSSLGDFIAIILLTITIVADLVATGTNTVADSGFDYRTTINPWVRGLLTFKPDAAFMETVPLPFKIHMVSAFALFGIWPFTRLVHVFSLPLLYLHRGYVLYRKRIKTAGAHK